MNRPNFSRLHRAAAAFTAAALLVSFALPVSAEPSRMALKLDEDVEAAPVNLSVADSLPAKSAILMDQQTGKVLYEQNADEQLPPASVTKVMTLLLTMEALDSGKITLEDMVITSEFANSMGGSQIWLKVGEAMSVHDLLKAVAVSSANDASVALGEHIAGSSDAFVQMMNKRAQELGMTGTNFLNCTGLDEDGHVTTARDIAIMSRELMTHTRISEYSTIWMDSLRGGETELVNTNKLVRFYNGCTGLKTGTTSGAGSCLSATAARDGLSLVAVVMGCATSDDRFSSAKGLLDYGFANYCAVTPPSIEAELTPVPVLNGTQDSVPVVCEQPEAFVLEKGAEDTMTQEVTLAEDVAAPVEKGQVVGKVEVCVNGEVIGSYNICAGCAVEKMTVGKAFSRLLTALLRRSSEPQTGTPTQLPTELEAESSAASEAPLQSSAVEIQ